MSLATSVDSNIVPATGARTTLRPSPLGVAIFAGGIPLGFLVLAWNQALWNLTLAYALLALVVICADALLLPKRRDLDVQVTVLPSLPVGERGQVRVDVTGPRSMRATRLTFLLEQSGPAASATPATAPTTLGRLAVALPLLGLRRGRIRLEALWLRWRGPLGLVEQRCRLPVERDVDIVPVVRGLRGAALNLAMDDPQFGIKAQLQQGEGSEFEALREHVQGLDNRHIDWKRSARHNKLLSKVYRTERNHQIILAFDTGHLMLEPIAFKTRLDHAIEAALLLGWVSLKSGDLVGSFAFDASLRQFVAPGAGLGYLSRIQQAATRLAYATEETNFTLGLAALNQRLRRRALVVLFTDFVDTVTAELLLEAVQRIANRHVVLFVTMRDPTMTEIMGAAPACFMPVARSVIAQGLLRERAIVLERLARMGVHVLDVEAGGLSSKLINKYLAIKGTGGW